MVLVIGIIIGYMLIGYTTTFVYMKTRSGLTEFGMSEERVESIMIGLFWPIFLVGVVILGPFYFASKIGSKR